MNDDKNLLTDTGAREQDSRSLVGKWKTKDGREIDVKDMEDTHVLRTIALLERRLVDLGLQDVTNDIFVLIRAENIEEAGAQLKVMLAEAERRKLSGWAKFGIELVQKVLE